jgi:hypothetical protein
MYQVKIDIPRCDLQKPNVAVISKAEDWDAINDPAKTVFCVTPGNYLDKGEIRLTASGTAQAQRVIRYYNPAKPGDSTHPVKMPPEEQAVINKLVFDGADHWLVDRIVVTEPGQVRTQLVTFKKNTAATDNVLNRLLIYGGGEGGGLVSFNGASNVHNVLQDSVVRNTIVSPKQDNHCVVLSGDVKGSKVLGNEIYNCAGDGLQIHPGVYEGTLIADNDFYNEPTFADFTENGIDIKGGGAVGPENWVRIEHNRMFGLGGKGGTGGSEGAIDFSNPDGDRSYILVKDNILVDDVLPITTNTGKGKGSVHHISIIGNVIYNAGAAALEPIKATHHIEVYFNTIIGLQKQGVWLHGAPEASDIRCNVIVNGEEASKQATDTEADDNAYYNTMGQLKLPGTNDLVFKTAKDSGNSELKFERKRLTGPETYTVPYAVTSNKSPHRNLCSQVSVGSRPDIGVDDSIWKQSGAGRTTREKLVGKKD